MTYDAARRMSGYSVAGGIAATYSYDGLGARWKKVVTGGSTPGTTKYLNDTRGLTQVLQETGPDPVSGLTRTATYAPGLAQHASNQGGAAAWSYFHSDSANTRLLTDGAGAVANRWEYDPFGAIRSPDSEDLKSDFAFAGEQRDRESSLVNLRARYYDSGLGRFINRDTLSGAERTAGFPQTFNRFVFALNNPLSLSDPSGYCPEATGPLNQPRQDAGCEGGSSEAGGYDTFDEVAEACDLLGLRECSDAAGDAPIPATAETCSIDPSLIGCESPGTGDESWGTAGSERDSDDDDSRPDNDCVPGGVVNVRCTPMETVVKVEVVVLIRDPITGQPRLVLISGVAPMAGSPGGGSGKGGSGKERLTREEMKKSGMTAREAIARYKIGKIHREFPSQYYDKTLEEIERAARQGDWDAKKVLKILFQPRFDK